MLSFVDCNFDTAYENNVKSLFAMSSLGADHLLAISSWQIVIHQTFCITFKFILSAAVTYCVPQKANKVNDISCNIFITLLWFWCVYFMHSHSPFWCQRNYTQLYHWCTLTIKYLPDLVNLLILNCSLQLLRIYN